MCLFLQVFCCIVSSSLTPTLTMLIVSCSKTRQESKMAQKCLNLTGLYITLYNTKIKIRTFLESLEQL